MIQKNFEELCEKIHQTNVSNGWWKNRLNIPQKMKNSGLFTEDELIFVENLIYDQLTLLQISELVEAMEARRVRNLNIDLVGFEGDIDMGVDFKTAYETRLKDNYWDEKIDTFIRLMDECGHQNIPVIKLIELKNQYNSMRGERHGGKIS